MTYRQIKDIVMEQINKPYRANLPLYVEVHDTKVLIGGVARFKDCDKIYLALRPKLYGEYTSFCMGSLVTCFSSPFNDCSSETVKFHYLDREGYYEVKEVVVTDTECILKV